MSDDAKPDVRHNPARHRFELWRDDARVGQINYEERDGLLVLTHTEVDSRLEGHGLGSALIRATLEQLDAAGTRIRPDCPFVKAYVQHHPEFVHLVPEDSREQYGLTP